MELIALGGYGSYTYNFSDGSSTSSIANIVNIPDPEDSNLSIGRKLEVLTQPSAGSKIIRVTDALGFYKDFTFNLYPVLTVTSPVAIQSSNPVSLSYNDYGNPNTKTLIVQNYSSPNYINGSLYGSTVTSLGVYTAGASIPSTTEYVLIEIPKATGGTSSARITLNVSIQWPFGTLGDLIINSGQTVNLASGNSYDYNNITINSGGTLNISGTGAIILGASGNVVINGNIISASNYNCGNSASVYDPFSSSNFSFAQSQASGGGGGNGGWSVDDGTPGGYGGNGSCGYGAGGGGGASGYATGGNGGSGGASGGVGNYGVGSGGTGMSTFSTGGTPARGGINSFSGFQNSVGGAGGGSGGGAPSYFGGGGGGGGFKGLHKNSLMIRIKGSLSGTGTISLAGTNGYNGGNGAQANLCSYDTGNGGGGGGGAGGSGGHVYIYYRGSNSFSLSSISNSGGLGGSAGGGGAWCGGSNSAGGAGGNGNPGISGNKVLSLY